MKYGDQSILLFVEKDDVSCQRGPASECHVGEAETYASHPTQTINGKEKKATKRIFRKAKL